MGDGIDIERGRRTPSSLGAALAEGITSLYQPIVQLDSGRVIAFEALARGPRGSALELPLDLFAAARGENRIVELDLACHAAALTGALHRDSPLRAGGALFVNAEPEVLTAEADSTTTRLSRPLGAQLRVFVEITERALTLRPAALLRAVERLRAAGFGIALDDVGADCRSLALLPLLRPDIVKLDISLIHNHPSRTSGEVMNGVCAYQEQSGAAILAEGVEHEGHVSAARSLGASFAQGWHFGRPGPLPVGLRLAPGATKLGIAPRPVPSSPVELVHAHRSPRVGRKDVLLSVSRALEAQALELREHAVVVSTFQDATHFTSAAQRRYTRLASRLAFVGVLGVGLGQQPAPGVRGGTLAGDDALAGEWDIAVLGPHFAGALVARDLGDHGPDAERRFEFVLTFDRELVIDVAAALIHRVRPVSAETLSLAA